MAKIGGLKTVLDQKELGHLDITRELREIDDIDDMNFSMQQETIHLPKLRLIEIPSCFNSLYIAVAMQVFKDAHKHTLVRNQIIDYMEDEKNLNKFVSDREANLYKDFYNHCYLLRHTK